LYTLHHHLYEPLILQHKNYYASMCLQKNHTLKCIIITVPTLKSRAVEALIF